MGIVALICLLILFVLIPSEIWWALFYIGLILFVGFVGFWAFIFWIAS